MTREAAGALLRSASAVLAAALVMALVSLIALSDVRVIVPGQPGALWICSAGFLCGLLLAFASDRPFVAMGLAIALAAILFGIAWTAIVWTLLGRDAFTFIEVGLSDLVSLYLMPRALLMLLLGGLSGLVAVGGALLATPARFRP
jgi:hypothetical protein